MEQGSLSELEGSYKKISNHTSSGTSQYDFNSNRVGYPGVKSGFQSLCDQDVADKCVNVPPCHRETPYRTINGACNNLNFPMWGMEGTALVRLLPPNYGDGINKVTKSKSGKDLLYARELRTMVLPDKDVPDDLNMMSAMQWGQLVSHDVAHIVQQDSDQGGLDCCAFRPAMTLPRACMQIFVPNNDSFYSQHNVKCLNFVRSTTTDNLGCRLEPQQQIAKVTHLMDASIVYGNNDKTANSLRTFVGGKLKVQLTTDKREFPPNSKTPDKDCDYEGYEKTCYVTGDDRANLNTGFTILQILLLREHNRLTTDLSKINPHWKDEKLYQEARRILIAVYQRITYQAFLPKIIGDDAVDKFGLRDGYDNDDLLFDTYNVYKNPSTLNEFATAAWRSLHSMVPGQMVLFDEDQNISKTLRIDDFYFRPHIIQQAGNFDRFLRGLAWQPARKQDRFFTDGLSNLLFKSSKPWGTDLISIDITRGRDHGLPSYNSMREACGHPRATDFSHFTDLMSEEAILKLKTVYQHVDDVELLVGGLFESPVPRAIVGSTFQCIIVEQFLRWRNGDRFYYEFGGQSGSFTKEQVAEIRKSSLAGLICLNGDNITDIQPDVFLTRSYKNEVQPCKLIPTVDFSPWKEV